MNLLAKRSFTEQIYNLFFKMNKKPERPDIKKVAEGIKKDLRRFAKVYCLKWFDDSFQNQGFTDAAFVPWPKRKQPDRREGGAILVDTTFLRKSLGVLDEGQDYIKFGTHVPYAAVHNWGLRARGIAYVRGFHRNRKGRREQVRPHHRKIDIQYPKRQFIGESQQMLSNIEAWLFQEIENRFKNIL